MPRKVRKREKYSLCDLQSAKNAVASGEMMRILDPAQAVVSFLKLLNPQSSTNFFLSDFPLQAELNVANSDQPDDPAGDSIDDERVAFLDGSADHCTIVWAGHRPAISGSATCWTSNGWRVDGPGRANDAEPDAQHGNEL